MLRQPCHNVEGYALLGWLMLCCRCLTSASSQPPETPFPRIEAGMHTAPINRIDVDAQERFLVTASEDKTARVWNLATGELLTVLRPPLGPGNEGKVYAVAIAPDGATVATAGWSRVHDNDIYLFDRASGRLQRRITGLPEVINHLAYSSDGRYLAAALGEGHGIRVYETRDFREIARDSDYGDSSYWAEFDSRGRLVTTCYDGYVRLYDASFTRLARSKAPGGTQPFAVRFSSDGLMIAVGFGDTTAVNVLSSTDLSLLYAPDRKGVDKSINSVAWSRDGNLLYAAGRYDDAMGIRPALQWSQAGRGPVTALPAATNTIMDLHALADGRLVFGAQDPAFGVFGANGSTILSQGPVTVDYRGRHTALQVSHDGLVVELGFDTLTSAHRWDRHLARLRLAEGQMLVDPPPLASGAAQMQQRLTELGYNPGPADGTLGPRTRAAIQAFQRARGLVADGAPSPALQHALGVVALTPPRIAGLAITDWNSYEPKLDGKPLPLERYEQSRCLALAPDASRFLLGTEWYLRLFDRQGQQMWAVPVPSTTWAVNITGDGRLAVTAFNDGTLRWYRMRDGAELLALFLHADGKRWVLWTPEGFFNASPGGEALVGYHLNQGPDAAGEFVTVEQLYRLFYRPELVARRLEEGVEPALQEALARMGNVRQVLTAGLPPALQLLSPPESQQRGRDFLMEFTLNPKNGGLGQLVYRVNGVVVGDPTARPGDIAVPHYRRPFTLPPGRNVLSVTATNAAGTIESTPVQAVVHVQAEERQPALYVLAVGVSNYRDSALKLRYAAHDATALAETLQRQGRKLFASVTVQSLLDGDATRDRISAAFRDLAGTVQEHDVFVLYLSGHGTVLDGEYHFLPADLVYANQQALRTGSVRQDQLVPWLGTIKAQKSLVVLDTCHAGTFVTAAAGEAKPLLGTRGLAEKGAIDRLMRASGRATIASSSEQQFALEGHENHGVFTYALLQGLRGAAKNPNGEVTVPDLMAYVAREVPQLTLKKWGYEQFPMHQFQGRPFAIGLVQP